MIVAMHSQYSFAAACDYTPSHFIGAKYTTAAGVMAGTTAAAGAGMNMAGLYSITHTAGMAMLGSTAAGASAAGTVGIIAGTAGIIGTVGAVLLSLSPLVIVPAALVTTGIGLYEGVCYIASDDE